MSLSVFGLAVLAICGYLLFFRGPLSLLASVMLFSLLGGSAAIVLTALGGASVRPELLAIVILSAAVCAPGAGRAQLMPSAIMNNFPLVVFCVYGAATAFILPRLFAGEFQLVPLNPRALTSRFDTAPLHFTPQNITTAFYLLATMMAALAAWIAVQHKAAARTLVLVAIIVGAVHVALGLADLVLTGTPLEAVLEFFRNANYAQHNQAMDGFIRINGIFPEPSAYATFALPWFVLNFELWLRNISPVATGFTAAGLLSVLSLSLSSTAIVGLVIYFVIFAVRCALVPSSLKPSFFLVAGAVGVFFVLAGLSLALVSPEFVHTVTDLFLGLTVEKSETSSGVQRLAWARQGVDLFVSTYGVGVGAGSFRSSSMITAIMGSSGVIGLATFLWFLFAVMKPLHATTYRLGPSERDNVGAALSWSMLGAVLPASFASASLDPGVVFGVFSGASLGLRRSDFAMAA